MASRAWHRPDSAGPRRGLPRDVVVLPWYLPPVGVEVLPGYPHTGGVADLYGWRRQRHSPADLAQDADHGFQLLRGQIVLQLGGLLTVFRCSLVDRVDNRRILGEEQEGRKAELIECDAGAARLTEMCRVRRRPAESLKRIARFGHAQQGEIERIRQPAQRGHALRAGGQPHGHHDPSARSRRGGSRR